MDVGTCFAIYFLNISKVYVRVLHASKTKVNILVCTIQHLFYYAPKHSKTSVYTNTL